MKLHLPSPLRKALLAALCTVAAAVSSHTADAAVLFEGVSIETYTDFGQNCGRYVAGRVNDMLQTIRERDHGIVITYKGGMLANDTYTISLDQGMIDFASASSTPVDAAVGYGFLATVAHNGVLSPTYTANEVGGNYAVRYNSIDYKRSDTFHLESATDYKVSRLNKLVTDAQPSELFSGSYSMLESESPYLYRTGSGAMELGLMAPDGSWGSTIVMDIPYIYATGGIVTMSWSQNGRGDIDDNFGIFHYTNPNIYTEITGKDPVTRQPIDGRLPNPLPYRVRSGDSGSPTWVWNLETKSYQYVSAAQSGGQWFTQDRGSLKWSQYAMESCNVTAALGTSNEAHTIWLYAVNRAGDTITGVGDNVTVSTTPYSGNLVFTNAQNEKTTVSYVGIQEGKHSWLNLSSIKDNNNWFNYGSEYFNASKYGPGIDDTDKEFSYADMFETNSLVFKAADNDRYTLELQADVDLGIGFVQFGKAAGYDGAATFKVQSAAGHSYVLDSAGFAIDKDVTVELDLKNSGERMTEWRKAGEGDLRITGSGNTNALLNVGGSGTVSLERENGYAAYNVLASSGSNLVIKDRKQVYRDVTLGANGATLDLQVGEFEWNNSAAADGNGFKSLHMLVEKDVLTNTSDKALTVTIKDADARFVGAFEDTKQGAIQVVYDAGKDWVMNTVFTDLTKNKDSSFTISSGAVTLEGINTVHGKGSASGSGTARLVNQFDWHYADAKMNVTVGSGAEFTLGSHARLKGDVTVKDGGVFNMTEYTTHRMEYLEGGQTLQDTYEFRDYFGLHGNIHLEEGALFNVAFTPEHYYQDTDSESVYAGAVSGSGNMSVDTAGGSLVLTGENTFSGEKYLQRGTLIAANTAALGDTSNNKWWIDERGVLVVRGAGLEETLEHVDDWSQGVVALTQNEAGGSSALAAYEMLIIGAEAGQTIQFGEKDTDTELEANSENQWLLGGGGGELVVNYALVNENGVLVLGNKYTTGTVTLTNTDNNFSRIDLVGGVTLKYDKAKALGGAEVALEYGNRIIGSKELIASLTNESAGAVLLDNMREDRIDLSEHGSLSLSADKATVFTGTIDLGDETTYHFGGGGGKLTLDTDLKDGTTARNMVVDAQFYQPVVIGADQEFANSVIELKQALKLTGDVTVQGYAEDRLPEDDPLFILTNFSTVTLQLSAEDALATAQRVYLNDGGLIDVNGTKQTLHSLMTAQEDDVLFGVYCILDSSAAQTGELVLDVTAGEEDTRWKTVCGNIATPKLTKTGSGTLEMNNVTESSLFTIEDGTVKITSRDALNKSGVTRVTGPGVLDVTGLAKSLDDKNIVLDAGGTMKVGSNAVSGRITANEGLGTIEGTAATTQLSAAIGAAEGATLALKGQTFRLTGAEHNKQGGTIELQANQLTLANASGVSIGGTLAVNRNATLSNEQNGANHTIERLQVGESSTLTVSGKNNCTATWNIHELAGSGSVTWNATNTGASRMVLDGPGSFSGTLTVQGGSSAATALVLAHDDAAQNARINLSSGHAVLAVDTANARIGGLDGNSNSMVSAHAPAATLTTTGAGEYTFSGTVSTGLNLVMAGTGTQTYNGTVEADNVAAQQGTLRLHGEDISIAGDVTVARGAVLETTKTLELKAGQYLCSVTGAEGAGTLTGNINFNGGGLSFDAAALNGETAALKFNGTVTHQGELAVAFTNTSQLSAGSVLNLTDGYLWAGTSFTASGVDYLEAAFTMADTTLQVAFTQKEGNRIWNGTQAQTSWGDAVFGQEESVPSHTDVVIFNDSAESHDVRLEGEIRAHTLRFDNSEAYTMDTAKGMLAAENVLVGGSGTVELGTKVAVSDTVEIAAGSKLILRGSDTVTAGAQVSGDGTLVFDMESTDTATLDDRLEGNLNRVEVNNGTLASTQTLRANELAVGINGVFTTTVGSILSGGTVQSSGTVQVDTAGKNVNLTTAIAAGTDGTAGILEKVGNGTLNVQANIAADTVRVNGGTLNLNDRNRVPAFVTGVQHLEVNEGATAYIGSNAYDYGKTVATSLSVNGGTLQLAVAQKGITPISGPLSVTNGGTLHKVDGGLLFTGQVQLGSSAQDNVTLSGNWGKSGMIFDGEVSGSGHVKLTRGNATELYTFNNGGNTFNGEIEATQGTSVVVGSKTALASATSVNLNSGSSLVLAADEVDVQALNGSGTVDFSATSDRTAAVLNITKGGSFGGSVEANISVTKSGSGTQSFTGNASHFSGALTVNGGAVSLGSGAMDMINSATAVTVGSGASLLLAGAANVSGDMDIQGTLSLGGTINTQGAVQVGNGATIILGGDYTDAGDGVRLYNVFTTADGGSVAGWDALTEHNFSGFGSAERGAVVELVRGTEAYQVKVSTKAMKAMDLTWSSDVAAGVWDDKLANFSENGQRTSYMAGDRVSIASAADITMGMKVTLYTLTVKEGANATVRRTAENDLNLQNLHVKGNSSYSTNALASDLADTATVDKGSTLEITIGSNTQSGTVNHIKGEGTLILANTAALNIDDENGSRLSGGRIDATGFTGTVSLGSGTNHLRFHSSNITNLGADATIEVNQGAQYWAGSGDRTLQNNIILHGNSAVSGATKDNFGAVRDVTVFNGKVSIDGNAMISCRIGNNQSITFNNVLEGLGDDDTLSMGCHYSNNATTYEMDTAADATGLANMAVLKSGGSATTVNVYSQKGLAKNLIMGAGTGQNAEVNIVAANRIESLKSAAGDGVVHIWDALALSEGANYGGLLNLADAVSLSANDVADTVKVKGSVELAAGDASFAAISGNGATRLENAHIQLAAGTQLELRDIVLAANSRVTDDAATLLANGLKVEAQVGVNLVKTGADRLTVGQEMLTYGDASLRETVQADANSLAQFTLSNIQDVRVEGTGLVFTLTGNSYAAFAGYDWTSITLSQDNGGALMSTALPVSLAYTDAKGYVYTVAGMYSGAEGGAYSTVYFKMDTAQIPEPATATLSLLALAALAARRRRHG